jgi:O-antigen/teichoic acid export membrane protein
MNVKALVKNSCIYGAGEVLNKFLSVAMIPLFTRYLSPEDYGIISIAMMLYFIIHPIINLGQSSATTVVFFEKEDLRHRSETIWSCASLLASTSVLFAFIFWLLLPYLGALLLHDASKSYLLFYIVLASMVQNVTAPFIWMLNYEKKATRFAAASVLSTVVGLLFNVWFVIYLDRKAEGWLEANLLQSLASFLIYTSVSVPFMARFSCAWEKVRELVRFGTPMLFNNAFISLSQYQPRFIISYFLGLEVLGVYTVGFSFGNTMNLFLSALLTAWPSFYMACSGEEVRHRLSKALNLYILVFGSLVVAAFVLAKPVTALLTAEAFHGCYPIVGLTALSIALGGLFQMFVPGAYYAKKPYLLMIPQVIGGVSSALLTTVGIYIDGMVGAAVGICIAQAVSVLVLCFLNLRLGLVQAKTFAIPNYFRSIYGESYHLR